MRTEATNRRALDSSLWGVGRGVFVHTLIHPIEVTKYHQQSSQKHSDSATSIQIVRRLLQQKGIGAFYQGLPPQLLRTSIKQVWVWPTMTTVPSFLQGYNISALSQQAFTGIAIATIDAAVATPLERAKIRSAVTGTSQYQLNKDAWKGFTTHWAKLSVNWSTFLIAQQHLRTHYQQQQQEPLTLPQLAKIGTQVAFIVSLASAPLDRANTIKQAQDLGLKHFLANNTWYKLYRGWPLSALSLTIHNVASVIVLDKLSRK